MKASIGGMRYLLFLVMIALGLLGAACGSSGGSNNVTGQPTGAVPSVRLTYRYEGDVPAPEIPAKPGSEERNAAVQADFDQRRPGEVLDDTFTSPNKKSIAAVYHRTDDLQSEFRIDIYSADGTLLKKVTSDLMAVHFPDTISWSPDSANLAFVAMLRVASGTTPTPVDGPDTTSTEPSPAAATDTPAADAAANSNANANMDANAEGQAASPAAPTPEAPTGIMTFRTEQLYVCGSDGSATRPITQNEGFIYFYYVWSPDSTMLAALAAHSREWAELNRRADAAAAVFVPMGRPRIVELTGRERRLDDALTAVQPVWSPDSTKVAEAFDTQIRIYDALGTNPTQAAVPLRNDLLLSSQAYDKAQASSLNADANNEAANTAAPSTLPDPATLVSFNPIVTLAWTAPELLYFETAFVRKMKNESDSVNSFARWHRIVLASQGQ